MKRHPVWIDCDPGTDDAAALLCAHALKELEICGISTVAGNVEGEKTYLNALRLVRLMGAAYPVFRGADRPLMKEPEPAYRFHGENGLGGAELPLPETYDMQTQPAWEALYQTAKALDGRLELIATGPLTNVALAILRYPALRELLRRIVIMGGAASGGNRTPAAEYNIYADPQAAKIVFGAGIDLTMCGLDVTNRAAFTEPQLRAVLTPGSEAAQLFYDSLMSLLRAQTASPAARLHDVVAVLFAAKPELFSGRMAGVRVETAGTCTMGKTVTDLWSDKKFPEKNAFVVLDMDYDAFVREVTELIRSYT